MKKRAITNDNPGRLQISILLLLGFLMLDYLTSENLKTEMQNTKSDAHFLDQRGSKSNLAEFIEIKIFKSLSKNSRSKQNKSPRVKMHYCCNHKMNDPLNDQVECESLSWEDANRTSIKSTKSNVNFY